MNSVRKEYGQAFEADSLTTILNVDGVELHINPLGEVSAGDSFQVFLADRITGTPVNNFQGQ